MKIQLLFLLLSIGIQCLGQQLRPDVLASSGTQQFSTDNQAYLSFTVGETAVQTLNTPNVSLGQGFHQKAQLIVSTENPGMSDWALQVYPNPVGGTLYVRYNAPEPGAILSANILDALGRPLGTVVALSDRNDNAVLVDQLPSGSYFLILRADSGRSTTVPFIKASND